MKNNNQQSNKQDTNKPFFARFLEGQELEAVRGGAKPPPFVTLKYPSDDDEYPIDL